MNMFVAVALIILAVVVTAWICESGFDQERRALNMIIEERTCKQHHAPMTSAPKHWEPPFNVISLEELADRKQFTQAEIDQFN